MPPLGLGLALQEGEYEGLVATWLRWCDEQGQILATGKEWAEQERDRAEREKAQADALAARLRELRLEE